MPISNVGATASRWLPITNNRDRLIEQFKRCNDWMNAHIGEPVDASERAAWHDQLQSLLEPLLHRLEPQQTPAGNRPCEPVGKDLQNLVLLGLETLIRLGNTQWEHFLLAPIHEQLRQGIMECNQANAKAFDARLSPADAPQIWQHCQYNFVRQLATQTTFIFPALDEQNVARIPALHPAWTYHAHAQGQAHAVEYAHWLFAHHTLSALPASYFGPEGRQQDPVVAAVGEWGRQLDTRMQAVTAAAAASGLPRVTVVLPRVSLPSRTP